MSKYKIEVEIDVDFDKIFSEIPDGLFAGDDKERHSDEHYELGCIENLIAGMYIGALDKKIKHLASDKAAYHKHHDECNIAVAKQIQENYKITKL